MKPRANMWWHLATGDIAWRRVIFQKNIDCAEFMRVRFTIDSDWRRMSVWIYGALKRKHKYSLDLDYFEAKRYVDDVRI